MDLEYGDLPVFFASEFSKSWRDMAWEQQAVCRLSTDFDVTSNAACRSAVQMWAAEMGIAVKVRVGRAAGPNMTVYAYCQAHKECPCVWRHAFDVTEAGAKEQTIHMKGTHGNEPRLVRGPLIGPSSASRVQQA